MSESTAKNVANELLDFINNSPTMYNAVSYAEKNLRENGFIELNLKKKWTLEKAGRYYIKVNASGLIAFVINGYNIL